MYIGLRLNSDSSLQLSTRSSSIQTQLSQQNQWIQLKSDSLLKRLGSIHLDSYFVNWIQFNSWTWIQFPITAFLNIAVFIRLTVYMKKRVSAKIYYNSIPPSLSAKYVQSNIYINSMSMRIWGHLKAFDEYISNMLQLHNVI